MRILISAALLSITSFIALVSPAKCNNRGNGSLTVISFNIRFGTADDGENSWEYRKTATLEMLDALSPDIIGLQEAFSFQIEYISENYPAYGWVGKSRLGEKDAEHPAVFYNRHRFKLIKWGKFWLSDTPQCPSLGWDAAFERNATWLLLKDRKSGERFFCINTHLDHVGKTARLRGLEAILFSIREMNTEGLPVVLTGDLNAEACDPAIGTLCGKMLDTRLTALDTDSLATYNGWGKSRSSIDYIWYSGFKGCTEYRTIQEQYGDAEYISDHYPIKAVFVF